MHLLRPACHYQDIVHPMNPTDAKARTQQTAFRMDWRLLDETDNRLIYRVGASWGSWAEVVTVTFQASTVSLASQCRCITQIFDWGKNRLNCAALATDYSVHPESRDRSAS